MAKLFSIFISGVWVFSWDWYIEAFVEFEFLWSYAVVFAGFFAGKGFVWEGFWGISDIVWEFCDGGWFEVLFVCVAPGVATVEGFFFCEWVIILGFCVVVWERR